MTQAQRRKVYLIAGVDPNAEKKPVIRLVDGDEMVAISIRPQWFGQRMPEFIEGRDSHIEVGRDWLARAMDQ